MRDKDNVYIYVSGTSFVRQPEELAGCSGETPDKDPNTARFRIDMIKVPLARPQDAKVISSPRIFGDTQTGALNALKSGGTHGIDDGSSRVRQPREEEVFGTNEIGFQRGGLFYRCGANGVE